MNDFVENVFDSFKKHLTDQGMDSSLVGDKIQRELVIFLLVKGVKIGGIYEHWKGVLYQVTGIGRNADDWNTYEVEYVEVGNIEHKAHRPIADFLGWEPRANGPRFKLIR